MRTFAWLKGHGTENDFLVLPDEDASAHGDLEPALVAALCDRRSGLGADGVLRVVRSARYDDPAARSSDTEWFMDYRNADGTAAQMCGNGLRVFARYLLDAGLVDPAGTLRVGTRGGTRSVHVDGDRIRVEMGTARVLGAVTVDAQGRRWPAVHVDVGNPHAVTFVDDLGDAGPLLESPGYERAAFPDGVNLEFVVRRAPGRLAMRVFERGVGETRSCGTGACAAVAAAMSTSGGAVPATYEVEVPGGRLGVTQGSAGAMVLEGPAVIVASGEFRWSGG